MGCAPSRSISPALGSDEQEKRREEYQQQAQDMLSTVRVRLLVQRRRARLSGEEKGTYWVYWRPQREGNGRRKEEVE